MPLKQKRIYQEEPEKNNTDDNHYPDKEIEKDKERLSQARHKSAEVIIKYPLGNRVPVNRGYGGLPRL